MNSELGAGKETGQSKEAQVGGWGCSPVIGRDGDQRLNTALEVDLCGKSPNQAKETGYPALTHSPPESSPSLRAPGLPPPFLCPSYEIPTARPLPQALGPTATHTPSAPFQVPSAHSPLQVSILCSSIS